MSEAASQHLPSQQLPGEELIRLPDNVELRKVFLPELPQRNGTHSTNGQEPLSALAHKSIAPDPVRLPGRKADAAPITKKQLTKFCERLSAKDRARFDEYLNGAEIREDEPTREYKRYLTRLRYGRYSRQPGEGESETGFAQRARKLSIAARALPLTPEEQLIAKEIPEEQLDESPSSEKQAVLRGEDLRGLSVRRLPTKPRVRNVEDFRRLQAEEFSGATDRRIAELLGGGLDEATIIKVLQYENLPADLKGIDFEPKFDVKHGFKYYPILRTEEGPKLLKHFNEVKISASEIRDRIQVVKRKAARIHIEISKQTESDTECCFP